MFYKQFDNMKKIIVLVALCVSEKCVSPVQTVAYECNL